MSFLAVYKTIAQAVKKRKVTSGLIACLTTLVLTGFLVPEHRIIPVTNATSSDWNHSSFWYEPWGSSGTHKGIDIFAQKGASVIATNHMILLYQGNLKKGGKVIAALGPKWRIHYYAHLDSLNDTGIFISAGDQIGTVGTTGNAQGKAPHLHYSIVSIIPLLWRIDSSIQGYKKALYLNPSEYLMAR